MQAPSGCLKQLLVVVTAIGAYGPISLRATSLQTNGRHFAYRGHRADGRGNGWVLCPLCEMLRVVLVCARLELRRHAIEWAGPGAGSVSRRSRATWMRIAGTATAMMAAAYHCKVGTSPNTGTSWPAMMTGIPNARYATV